MDERARQGLIDGLSGLILVALGIVGLDSLARHPILTTFDFGTDPGPGLVPRLLLLALLGGGSVLVVLGAVRLWAGRTDLPTVMGRITLGRHTSVIAFGLLLAAYIWALPRFGFVPVTLVFAVVWMAGMTAASGGGMRLRQAGSLMAAAVVITAALYYVFKGFVKVPLP